MGYLQFVHGIGEISRVLPAMVLETSSDSEYNKVHKLGASRVRSRNMKNLNMIVWLTQLGLSVAFPLAGFVLLALWLRDKFNLGVWILIAGIFVGLICAIDGLRSSLKIMERLARNKSDQEPPPVSFNDHD